MHNDYLIFLKLSLFISLPFCENSNMFTGIVRATALIAALELKGNVLRYAVDFPSHYLKGLEKGASVSIDGVCQTVVKIENNWVWFEAIDETLFRTTLGTLKQGTRVNLERSARLGDEIGGHLLSGHVFGAVTLVNIKENIYTLQCPPEWTKYLFSKGFVALDGMSLTLVSVNRAQGLFTVHLIPETLKQTIIGKKLVGDQMNLEFDAMTQAVVETTERILKTSYS